MPPLTRSPVKAFSLFANAAFSLYIAALMIYPIGYGLDTGNSFGVARFSSEEGWRIMSQMVKGSETDKRLVMAILTNFRINLAAWWAVGIVSLYGFFIDYKKRMPIHLLGFLINASTGSLHLYHMGAFGDRWDEHLVPKDDPYHKIPIVSDWTVSLLNLIAFLWILSSTTVVNQEIPTKKD